MSYSQQTIGYARSATRFGFLAQFPEVLGADVAEDYQSRAATDKAHFHSYKILARKGHEDMRALDKGVAEAVDAAIVKAREDLIKKIRVHDRLTWTRELTDKMDRVDAQMRAEVEPVQVGFFTRMLGLNLGAKPGRGGR